jgi:hypothetical protein
MPTESMGWICFAITLGARPPSPVQAGVAPWTPVVGGNRVWDVVGNPSFIISWAHSYTLATWVFLVGFHSKSGVDGICELTVEANFSTVIMVSTTNGKYLRSPVNGLWWILLKVLSIPPGGKPVLVAFGPGIRALERRGSWPPQTFDPRSRWHAKNASIVTTSLGRTGATTRIALRSKNSVRIAGHIGRIKKPAESKRISDTRPVSQVTGLVA